MNDLGPRSRNDLDLEYSCIFSYSFSSLHLPIFRPQAASFWKILGLTFTHTKVYANKFDLGLKYVEVIQVSPFEQTMIGLSPQCYKPNFMTIRLLVWEKKIFGGFLPYMGMEAILVRWPGPTNKLSFPHAMGAPTSISQVVSEEKMFGNVD